MKILIVEDENSLARVLVEKFERENFEVKLVQTGDVVVETTKNFMPDVIALDIMLPKKNGLVVLEELKADAMLRNIPVVMISNLDNDEEIKKSIGLGAVDYFVKSQHLIKEIVEKVKEYSVKAK